VALSQLRELGDQAVAAVAASLVDGGAVLKAQLIASRFYEALRHELEESLSRRVIATRCYCRQSMRDLLSKRVYRRAGIATSAITVTCWV
jgi:hypothetical protein